MAPGAGSGVEDGGRDVWKGREEVWRTPGTGPGVMRLDRCVVSESVAIFLGLSVGIRH